MAGERAGVLFGISLYALLMLSVSSWMQMRARRWPSVAGELLELGTRRSITDDNYNSHTIKALYRYVVDGVSYEGSKVSAWVVVAAPKGVILQAQLKGVTHLEKGQVRVFYNPKNPKKSLLIRPSLIGLCVSLALALVPIGLHIYYFG